MLSINDFFLGPICFVVLLAIFSGIVRKYSETQDKSIFVKAFYFKMFCALAFTLIMALYYSGGDSEMYFFATKDIQAALSARDLSVWQYLTTTHVTEDNPLAQYFYADRTIYPVYEFMRSATNFSVPKLAVIPSIIFFKSYLCICMVFSFFALGGAIRLYKLFVHYFPTLAKPIAFAVLFLPSVCFWSSGLLKDSLCFGAVGYLLYAIFNVFIRKKNVIGSLLWIIIGAGLLYYIKVYILLALLPGITLWLFGEMNRAIKDPLLKNIATFLTALVAVALVVVLLNYITSAVNLTEFRIDNIIETSSYSRRVYQNTALESEGGAYFQFASENPVLLVLNGFVASLFRPFLWEITSPIVLLSALEASIFILLTFYFIFRRGIFKFFRLAFSSPVLTLCSSFAFIFAASIGATATNFGSLSRYKIPCLPFYLIMLFAIYYKAGLKLPKWTNGILNFIFRKQPAL